MLRKTAPASSMQKTYDECYLICSTAIYFEGQVRYALRLAMRKENWITDDITCVQNNESEALRAWRNALDQIYYHNAYKIPSSYQPRTETEKALYDSLRSMELQCKERVDLLDALRKSRREAEEEAKNGTGDGPSKSRESLNTINKTPSNEGGTTRLGGNSIPQASYADLPRLTSPSERRPVPPPRPSFASKKSSAEDIPRTKSLQPSTSPGLTPPSNSQTRARTPSPEKKTGGMLKTLRSNGQEKSSKKMATTLRPRPPPAAAKAASQVWSPPRASSTNDVRSSSTASVSAASNNTTWDPYTRQLVDKPAEQPDRSISDSSVLRPPSPSDYTRPQRHSNEYERLAQSNSHPPPYPDYPVPNPPYARQAFSRSAESVETAKPSPAPPLPPPHKQQPPNPTTNSPQQAPTTLSQLGPSSISYMKEFPNHPPTRSRKAPAVPARRGDRTSDSDAPSRLAPPKTTQAKPSPAVPRRAVGVASATAERQKLDSTTAQLKDRKEEDPAYDSSSPDRTARKAPKRRTDKKPIVERAVTPPTTDESHDSDDRSTPTEQQEWDKKVKKIMNNLPKGVDEAAAKQIFNEIVIQGDEVHWDDVAGLDIAKSALKETVVYPFLRPDLFMGLREPARGMLLFGPPGTGKTMLARAVATESKSVFFAISASSLTSKYLGESEKLVRALFALAKALAPSIIFVDEIDSLLGSRGGSSEHEATRRIKTEFLIQWSDLQKAAAGREDRNNAGDATRVLVLAATNLPWAIDEAARRRFVRRQYIPLPEPWVREQQLRTLLSAQKHQLRDRDLKVLVGVTEGFSGSDITALAKDAAMGPLRSLGEKLLSMKPEDIRGIRMEDFEQSLVNIRPSVSSQGLKEFEDWARDFGERGG
ncbi:hypothetical protein LTR37_021451 [Vermiconidia calcicola]|uniref:Uncharacterized protein n=1 Tax=Vermiconidia calcicola TaxID=1690605 RepID=A0ACC3M8V0_9PEZI|nr:hypothetical protein LTR37_021451 [Vermiconidia calcicola]